MNFVAEQLSVSTAEEENNYFTGQQPPVMQLDPNVILPAGTYRVLAGRLYRVVDGIPPSIELVDNQRQTS
jgi:hypothetical protein